MPALNLFKRNPDKPRLSIRERFRNAAARVMPRSRKSRSGGGADPARRAILTGSVASVAAISLPAAAAPGGDAVLIDAWAKFQEAWAHNTALSWRMKPACDAALASLPPLPDRSYFEGLTDEERTAFEEERHQHFVTAFDKHGVTAAQDEQDRFWNTVVEPLVVTIRNTTPTTLEGAAIKARYLLDYAGATVLETEDMSRLDYGDEALRLFIEQLAVLPLNSDPAATASTH